MKTVNFTNAYYIKLGKGGMWEESSIRENKVRIGWKGWVLEEINQGHWDNLKKKQRREYKTKSTATMDINALKNIAESTSEDVWITFHASQLWWCQLGQRGILEDKISKYRLVLGEWHNCDVNGNVLMANQIPGNLGKVQGFRATICKIKAVDDLRRLINGETSEIYQSIDHIRSNLITEVQKGLKLLHWKDFETLVDLLFRNAGWRRVSLLGETMKYADMELEEPVTGDKYQVQVKSKATLTEFETYAKGFSNKIFRKMYFVVHSPDKQLASQRAIIEKEVELILPERLAKMVVEFGLTDWLLKKIK